MCLCVCLHAGLCVNVCAYEGMCLPLPACIHASMHAPVSACLKATTCVTHHTLKTQAHTHTHAHMLLHAGAYFNITGLHTVTLLACRNIQAHSQHTKNAAAIAHSRCVRFSYRCSSLCVTHLLASHEGGMLQILRSMLTIITAHDIVRSVGVVSKCPIACVVRKVSSTRPMFRDGVQRTACLMVAACLVKQSDCRTP